MSRPPWTSARRPWSATLPLRGWNRELRHVIEPELTYRFVGGIGAQAQNVLLVDTTDIATNTNEVGLLAHPALLPAPNRPAALRP